MNWPVVLAAFGCLFVLGLLDNARGPLFPEVLRGLDLSDARGAWLFAAASAAGGVGSLAGAPLVRRLGPLLSLRLGLGLCAAGMTLLGNSPSFRWLVASSLAFGLSFGALSLVQGTLVQRGAPPGVQRRVFGGLHSMYGAASLLAPLAVLALARAGADWRGTFRLLACAPLALLAATVLVRDPALRIEPAAPDTAPAPAGGPAGAAPTPADPPPSSRPGRREVLVALMAALYVAAELSLSTRLVLHLERAGWGKDAAALALSTFFACLLLGRVLLGVVQVPWSHRAVLAGSAAASLLLTALGLALHPALLCAAGLSMAPFFPTASALVADEFPAAFERAMSTLLAAVCVVVMTAHGALGALSDAVGLHAALWLSPACMAGALALAVGTGPPRRI